jgi:hypothetical protein
MVRFLTLLAGLVAGPQVLQVAVSGPVDRVELRVDARTVAVAESPPWVLRCDLGGQLRPHRLEVVAFDDSGAELDRDQQLVNVPEGRAEAAIVPVADERGRVVAAELTWTSPEFDRPSSVSATLDDRPVAVRRGRRIDVSGAEADALHLLIVDFEFPGGLVLRRQLAFGAGFSGDAESGLSALPVRLEDLDELAAPDQLQGWFTAAGEEASVVGVERGGARLVIVRDPGAWKRLNELDEQRRWLTSRQRRRGSATELDALGNDVELRLLVAEPMRLRGRSQSTVLFPYSERPIDGEDGILRAAAADTTGMLGQGRMLGDAVALAGMRAAEGNLRRAVLLIVGAESEDVSRFTPDSVRGFLADLHVPLVVWDVSGEAEEPSAKWRADRRIETIDDAAGAARLLRDRIDRQRIVWIAGTHLPQTLRLSERAQGIGLVR